MERDSINSPPPSSKKFMLSTYDNPYSPFTEFDQWDEFDRIEKGYHTCEYVSRFYDTLMIDGPFTEDEIDQIVIDEIVRHNDLGVYIKLTYEEAEKLKEGTQPQYLHL